jgi:predicted NAD-dependent protein-ADP-ribosyltransferase YbiA (DUF1768 family)
MIHKGSRIVDMVDIPKQWSTKTYKLPDLSITGHLEILTVLEVLELVVSSRPDFKMLDVDYVPFEHMSLDSIRKTYTYGQLLYLDNGVGKLTQAALVKYLDDRINTLDWKHMASVFIQHTDAYMKRRCGHLGWDNLVSYTYETKEVVFYSKSKLDHRRPFPHIPTNWKRVLSNSHPSRLRIDNIWFVTAEHALQGLKLLHAARGPVKQAIKVLLGNPCPIHARNCGGRAAYKTWGVELDAVRWKRIREEIQRKVIKARIESDPLFVAVLKWSSGRLLIHYAPGTVRYPPFWGAFKSRSKETPEYVGENVLGKLLMEVRRTL